MQREILSRPTQKHHYPIKGQEAYTIMSVHVFVINIQKMDTEMDME